MRRVKLFLRFLDPYFQINFPQVNHVISVRYLKQYNSEMQKVARQQWSWFARTSCPMPTQRFENIGMDIPHIFSTTGSHALSFSI